MHLSRADADAVGEQWAGYAAAGRPKAAKMRIAAMLGVAQVSAAGLEAARRSLDDLIEVGVPRGRIAIPAGPGLGRRMRDDAARQFAVEGA